MIAIDSDYPPGTIGLATGELARFTQFQLCLERLRVPRGTRLLWRSSCYVWENRNALARDMEGAWLLQIDDDNTFEPDLLLKLLAREKPIVGSLYVKKHYPFIPHVYDYQTPGELPLVNHPLAGIPRDELVSVDACGTSGLLIQRPVLEALGAASAFDFVEVSPGVWRGDDVGFCYKARKAGYPIYVDTGCVLGHLAVVSVYPSWNDDGEGVAVLNVGNGVEVEIG